MKLVRYGMNGHEKPGLIDDEGRLRDLSVAIETIDQLTLSPQGLNSLRSIAPESLPRVRGEPRLGVPFTRAFERLWGAPPFGKNVLLIARRPS